MAWRWLAIVCLIGLAACMAAERESAPDSDIESEIDKLALPEQADTELCSDLAALECGPAEIDACSRRYACARQLWREDIVEDVYACIVERPCSDPDPANSCLHEVVTEKSDAERRYEAAESDLARGCGRLIELPPGQSDEVYEMLTGCIENNDACDSVSACAIHSLEALGEELCGSTETAHATTPEVRRLAMSSSS
jgi:hypothetical protein